MSSPRSDTAPRRAQSDASDLSLLERWRAGDTDAGEALFTRHYSCLARFFRNKVRADVVADLIQDTFMASVQGQGRIEDGARFRAYLLTIAYRMFCKHLRQAYKRGEAVDLDLDLDLVSVGELDPSPSSVIGRVQEQRLLLEGLRAISVNYQVVLELHYWEELSTAEVAEILGVPTGTVRSRLQRARDALEAAMTSRARSQEVLDSTLTRLEDWAAGCRDELFAGPSRP